MSHVFVVDALKQPLTPAHPGRARLLLTTGKAAVFRPFLFTILFKQHIEQPAPAPLRLKSDPGAKTTGLALLDDASGSVVWAAELTHWGGASKKALDTRRAVRRGQRACKPQWANRRRKRGWLSPSLCSRVDNILTWGERIRQRANVTALSQELVRFDLHNRENPDVAGVHYQQCTLLGYAVREYCLEKWGRTCAYYGATNIPLQIEHICACARGGTQRISNLTLACETCHRAKGTQNMRDVLAHDPVHLEHMLQRARTSCKDATVVNATRWWLFEMLNATGLPVETGSGGVTEWNRTIRARPKTHWLDAATMGTSTSEHRHTEKIVPLLIQATGRGHRRVCNVNDLGFPVSHRKRHRRSLGFQTGDLVRAVVLQRFVCRGSHAGRVAVKASGYVTITTAHGKVTDVPADRTSDWLSLPERSTACNPTAHLPIKKGHSSPACNARGSLARFLWRNCE